MQQNDVQWKRNMCQKNEYRLNEKFQMNDWK